ncbi:hypothetical protein [Flavobacterium silvaticum]|uniref:YhhN-like protein n=1 Tax=Flavobacterium silvaticum TaxID=1852020 RepID=A0A972FTP3_9FLAO|nr:hypothetical protein [Flavobacterium silvaticum]NMH29134.1 hypothetical protein [Flavobacterium silvaticum]
MNSDVRSKAVYWTTVIYFFIGIVEVIAELFAYKPLIYVFKPLLPFTLMAIYFLASERRSWLYFVIMTLSLLTNLLFIPSTITTLNYGLEVFLIHRVFIIIYLILLLKIRDFIPTIIATIPFLIVFFYLFMVTEVPESSFLLLIMQNLMISIFCGIAFSHYIMNDSKRNSWLLLSGILFGSLQFIVFVEKFYLSEYSPIIFRPIAMGLNVFAFYTFYEFVISTEKSDDNASSVN